MSSRGRQILFLVAAGGVGVLLLWGLHGLPSFGQFDGAYTDFLLGHAVEQRHATNVVMAVTFDYRGLDTLGEEFILFAAVMGVALLLRESHSQLEPPEDVERADGVHAVGLFVVPVTVVLGLWLVAHGHLTPGGGFQGGVAIAAALLVLYLSVGYRSWRRASNEEIADPAEGIGVGGYVVVGLAALISGAPFLHNVLGPGKPGTLLSGGSMNFLNWTVALEVAAANVTLYAQFLERYIAPLLRERE